MVEEIIVDREKGHAAVMRSHGLRERIAWSLSIGLAACAALSPPALAADAPRASTAVLKTLSVEDLMDLEVTSVSRRPEKLSETASAIQVVTQEDIRRSGVARLPEALRLASNLQVAQKNSHDWGISARGFNTELANKLLVMVDGRTVYTPLYSGVFWDGQDYLLEDLDRIEVISGPGGSVWGANAVNGVINITSKSAADTQGLYLEAGGGTEPEGLAGIRYGGALSANVKFRVYGKHAEHDASVLSSGAEISDSWRMSQAGFRVDTDGSTQNAFTLQGDYYYSSRERSATGVDPRLSGANLLGRWSRTMSDDSDMQLQVYYDRTELALATAAMLAAPAGVLRDRLDTYDLDFQHHFRLSARHEIVWGLGYRFMHDVVGNAPTVAFLPSRLDHDLFSGFVQDRIMLRDSLFLTLGSKLEHNDYTGVEYEPSGRLQWNYADEKMLWAAVSRAVRTPSRIDRDLRQPTGLPAPFPQSVLNGGADFASETVVAYELGTRAQLAPELATAISFFYNDYSDVRSTTPGPAGFPSFGFPLVFENNLEGETYGMELSATYQPLERWRLRGGYNLLKEHLRVKAGEVDFSNALNETADPKHQLSVRSSIDLPRSVELDLGLRWVDTLHNNNGPTAGTVPSYFEADVRIGWHASERLELSLVGENLLHDQHPEYGFPGPERPEIERSVFGRLRWQF